MFPLTRWYQTMVILAGDTRFNMYGEGGCCISNPMLILVNFFSAFVLGGGLYSGEEMFTAMGFRLENPSGCVWRSGFILGIQFPLPAHCVSVNTVHEKLSLYRSEQGLRLLKAFRQ